MKFFYKNATGLNSDIHRHYKQERELLEKIVELQNKTDEFSVIALQTYRNLLNQLRDSKSVVVSKIGKNKK